MKTWGKNLIYIIVFFICLVTEIKLYNFIINTIEIMGNLLSVLGIGGILVGSNVIISKIKKEII